ncbi:hypothetical protein ACJJID_04330 [Microbulbifer sp. CnH-101-G]|uniref:hypothetical protein n=1 Tax=Microbulbifer sp. CnH-101-G TaxID=3243393 RepID=UPI0040390340
MAAATIKKNHRPQKATITLTENNRTGNLDKLLSEVFKQNRTPFSRQATPTHTITKQAHTPHSLNTSQAGVNRLFLTKLNVTWQPIFLINTALP